MQQMNVAQEIISSTAGSYSGIKVSNKQTATAFHSANAIYISPPRGPSEAPPVYKSIVERARPVKSFCLCVKVTTQGRFFFFSLSVSTKGDRCSAALFYCTFGPPPSPCATFSP